MRRSDPNRSWLMSSSCWPHIGLRPSIQGLMRSTMLLPASRYRPSRVLPVSLIFRQEAKTDEIGVKKGLHLVLHHRQHVVQLLGIHQFQRQAVKTLV